VSNPTFIATFADGEVVRMSCWHSEDRKTLNLRRGIKLARAAHETRTHNRERRAGFSGLPVTVPVIVEARFEQEGNTLAAYDAATLAAAGGKT
jgi:hypothetical protein